ncbi:MAG: hypothetical protein WCZ23_05675 [Rhodospirillaceae bacterium]
MPCTHRKKARLAASMIVAAAVLWPSVTMAQTAPRGTPQGAATTSAVQAKADVAGFRSARFGMTEDEVRKAAAKDLSVKTDAFLVEENAVERTRVLTVKASDVLPDGGKAAVSYILGYTSKKLIQVNALWAASTDDTMTAEKLVANANVLTHFFMGQGFEVETGAVNAVTNGGLIVFRGMDAKKRMVQVSLLGPISVVDNEQQFTPSALQLSYVMDPVTPDIFRLKPGQF